MRNRTSTLQAGKMLQRRYSLALGIIAFLIISSQVMIQLAILSQQDDSRIVNIAGRQRMLSQKINKATFGIYLSEDKQDLERYVSELNTSLALWEKSHNGLQLGDEELGLPGKNSEKIKEMFLTISPQYVTMVGAAQNVVKLVQMQAFDKQLLLEYIRPIQDNEQAFLKGMDAIVFQYDAESKHKIKVIKSTEIFIFFVTFITLGMEIRFIFRPAQKQIESSIVELEASKENLEKLFETAPSAMILIDEVDMRVTKMNHMANEILGVLTPAFNFVDFINKLGMCQENMKLLIEQVSAGKSIENLEVVMQKVDKSSLVMLLSSNQIRYDDKNTILMGLSDITRLKEAEEVLKRYATTDDMTGLLNKRSGMLVLGNAFDRAISDKNELCVCFMDLDRLKMVNDTYGHEEGDHYIKTVSQVVQNSVSSKDTIFRYGGDEIVLIMGECDREGAVKVVQRIEDNLKSVSECSGRAYEMRLSFGLSILSENVVESPEAFLTIADQRMYENKRKNR